MSAIPAKATAYDVAAWILTGLGLLLIFALHLFPALMAGLLVHQLVHLAAPLLRITKMSSGRARLVVVGVLAALIVTGLTVLAWKTAVYLRSEEVNLPALLGRMAEIMDGVRSRLPGWALEMMPDNSPDSSVGDLNAGFSAMLRDHAAELQAAGKGIGLALAHIVVGMILGGIVSLSAETSGDGYRPLAGALAERVRRVSEAFRSIVFAQVRISALNTFLTFLYLAVALPAAGVHLPLVKTLIAVTFFAGLLPVVGNLISNTAIVVVSLSVSFPVALWSLAFLVAVHKLEYFVNARIVGGHINARTWELLLAMIVMESAFGLAGLVAAPIYYAYVKKELADRGLV
jgi:predicted PurR-regulated permease PerM